MPTLLIAEDSAMMRKLYENMFHGTEFQLLGFAGNGEEAVELYEKYKPDVVTLDITMPVMNGLEALRAIRAKNPQAVCVIVSALEQDRVVQEAMAAGAVGYIIKPIGGESIAHALRKILADAGYA